MTATRPRWLLALALALCSLEGRGGEAGGEAAPEEAIAAPAEDAAAFPATVPEGVPSLQMSTEFASPALAMGVYRPVGQVASRGVRVAPFTFRGWMQAGIGYDDNIGLSSGSKRGSTVLTLNPSLSIGLEGQLHRYFAVYRGSYARYSATSASNNENHNLTLQASDEWTFRLRTAFQYDFLRGQDPVGATGSAAVVADPWSDHRVRGTVAYGADGAPARVSATLGHSQRRYLERPGDGRNYDRVDVQGTFSYRVAPKTLALASVGRADISRDNAPTLDSTEMNYSLGIRWEATAKTAGTVRVGYATRSIADPAVRDGAAPTYEVGVSWLPLTYSAFNLTARRAFVEAVEQGSSSVIDNYGLLTWAHVWSDRTRSILAAGYGRQNHEGLGRTDTYYNFAARGSYRLERWLHLGAEYRRDGRTSTNAGFEYNRNVLLFIVESAI